MLNLFDSIPFDYTQLIGRELGNVTILKKLGHGNRGFVYIGFQKTLKRQVAVKILPKLQITSREQQDQFRDEAEIVAGLSHANIIPIFEIGEDKDFYFQIMQLISGSDLNNIIKQRLKYPVSSKKILPLHQIILYMIGILDGLGYAHDHEVVHQDIKPANILIEQPAQRPLIADFGIAKTIQHDTQNQDIVVGSPIYISPEQAAGEKTDWRTDIYSVGVVLFKMLAGILPCRQETVEEIMIRKIESPETFFTERPLKVCPIINPVLEEIILHAIEPNREKRYQDCNTFKKDVIGFQKTYLS
jgi:serine/threonine-protein kinase